MSIKPKIIMQIPLSTGKGDIKAKILFTITNNLFFYEKSV